MASMPSPLERERALALDLLGRLLMNNNRRRGMIRLHAVEKQLLIHITCPISMR